MILWYFPRLGGKEYVSKFIYHRISRLLKWYIFNFLTLFLLRIRSCGTMFQLLHHGLSIYATSLALLSGKAHFYILMVQFTEATTPFVNLRW
jgi:hypothetical protein